MPPLRATSKQDKRLARVRGTGALPAGAALALGVIAAAVVALSASVALDPAGARGHAAQEYALPPVARGMAPSVVTSTEIVAAGRGTPGEALLRWWQGVQLGAEGASATEGLAFFGGPAEWRTARELETIRYLFDERKPRLVDAEIAGDRARVLVVITDPDRAAPEGATHQLERFDLVRTQGRWRISPGFIHRRYAAEVAYARSAGRRSP